MIKTVVLNGAEICVEGLGGQNVIVKNLSSGTVYASAGAGVEQGGDGVAEIPAGGGEVIFDANGAVCLKGTGAVQLTGTNYETLNFKQPSSGESGGGSDVDSAITVHNENPNAHAALFNELRSLIQQSGMQYKVIATRERDPSLPDYGFGDESPVIVALKLGDYTGTTDTAVTVSGVLYDALNLSHSGEQVPEGNITFTTK